ncbi:MAG: hypothetical protein WCG83_01115 [Candidatus Peregrinibacteria bacterium]
MSDILSGKYRAPDRFALSQDDRASMEMAKRLRPDEKIPPLESIELSFELKQALEAWNAARIQLVEHRGDLLDSMVDTRRQLQLAAKMGSPGMSLIDPDYVFGNISPETIQDDHHYQRGELQRNLDSSYQRLMATREMTVLQSAQAQVLEQLIESGLIQGEQV